MSKSKINLCTTGIPEFWDIKAERFFFLGQWCQRYDRRDVWASLPYEILPHPWDNRVAMHEAALYEEKIFEHLLDIFTDFLNEVHGEVQCKQYWRIIIGPWLLHYVQIMHERYLCLAQALDLYPNLYTIGLAPSSFKIPRHFMDYLRGTTDDIYNLQLYSILLKEMGINMPVQEYKWDWFRSRQFETGSLWKNVLRSFRASYWRTLSSLWAKKGCVLMVDMYAPLKSLAKLMIATRFNARWCELPQPERWVNSEAASNPHPYRQKLNELAPRKKDLFLSFLIKTLPVNFPLIYLEGYTSCREWIQRTWRKSHNKIAMTANAFHGNETFKFLAAQLKSEGATLVDVQHGGSYGSALYNPIERLERKAADEFWSWGWGDTAYGIRPMPIIKISQHIARKNSAQRKKYILYVGNNPPRYHYRTWSCPSANQVTQYLEWQVIFINNLHEHILSDLVFRPNPNDRGWSFRQRLRDAFPTLKFDDPKNDYYAGLLGASLVVCDANQTTFLEALALNIPCIVFWDNNLWELRQEAEDYFQKLRGVGILFHDPNGAAKALNDVYNNITEWWDNNQTQQVRNWFVDNYALTSHKWIKEWKQQLLRITSESDVYIE